MELSAVSFDIFQTLADIHPRIPAVWRGILGNDFSEGLARKGAGLLTESLPEGFREASAEFVPMREFFRRRMEKVLTAMGSDADPGTAADIFRLEHRHAVVYPDVRACLEWVRSQMAVCFASDADREMAEPFLRLVPDGAAFLSEELGAYKQDLRGRFFGRLLADTGFRPEQLLHVGDSAADVLGARQAGIRVCLLEREGSAKTGQELQPDYRIHTLAELPVLLSELKN